LRTKDREVVKMDKKQMDEIRARCEAATSSPWQYDGMHNEIHAPQSPNGMFLIVSELRGHPSEELLDEFGHKYNADFDFIANARQDIPALLDALEGKDKLISDLLDSRKTWSDGLADRDRYKARAEALEEMKINFDMFGGVDGMTETVKRMKALERAMYTCTLPYYDGDGCCYFCAHNGDEYEGENCKKCAKSSNYQPGGFEFDQARFEEGE